MTRTTALLMLGAILLIVTNLLGEGGAMSRVAEMDKDRMEVAVDTIGSNAVDASGFGAPLPERPEPGSVVRPALVDDNEDVIDSLIEQSESEVEIDRQSGADELPESASGLMQEEGFDPRVG